MESLAQVPQETQGTNERRPSTAFGHALFTAFAAHTMTRKTHSHWCACGAIFVCNVAPDHCAVPDPYTCPNCEQQQYDDWLSTQPHPTQQETH